MYKLHLILKYLRKRRIAWVSLIAVMLCTAMVLVVISGMGGWLRMFRESFHGLTGDVIIHGQSLSGFPHYQEIIDALQADNKLVKAAVPTIQTFGLINIANAKTMGVQVLGYPIDRIGEVNKFPESLYRQHIRRIEAQEKLKKHGSKLSPDERAELQQIASAPAPATRPSFDLPYEPEFYRAMLPNAKMDVANWTGIIPSSGVLEIHKDENGNLVGREPFLYELSAKLTVLGVGPANRLEESSKRERNYWIVDDSHTSNWQYDQNTVYVPFDILQKDLGMDEQQAKDRTTNEPITLPARTSDIQVKVADEVDLNVARVQIEAIVRPILKQHDYDDSGRLVSVQTWEQGQATFLDAVEHELVILVILFGIISVVAIFLIFCIFYMIVVEKTRDIGIIKSVGATSGGVAAIFLGYGLAIGVVGAGLGLAASYLVVHNINQLHTWMGKALGIRIWSPETYMFDTIPNTMEPRHVLIIVSAAILASVLGALVPAIRAARMNPVEALRWE